MPLLRKSNQIIKKKWALQAQARDKQSGNDLCPLLGRGGSATVEAALVLPFFLSALCTVLVIAQFILAETAISHALLQTARVCARQESRPPGGTGSLSGKESSLKKLGGILETGLVFYGFLDETAVSSSYVAGGRKGILLSSDKEEDRIVLKASYILKVPVPFFRLVFLKHTQTISCRKFTGYTLHDSDREGEGDGESVYVAQYGKVYHTSLSCSHLTIHISDPSRIKKMVKSSHYRPCEKCMKKGQVPGEIYITKDGDCYHSTLSCSGLKRAVTVKKKSEIEGMRICSECGKNHGEDHGKN